MNFIGEVRVSSIINMEITQQLAAGILGPLAVKVLGVVVISRGWISIRERLRNPGVPVLWHQ